MTTTQTTRQDAQSRAVRTFIQGLAVDVLVAVAAVVLAWLPGADLSSRTAWIAVALAVAKTILTAGFSYVMRLKVSPASAGSEEVPPIVAEVITDGEKVVAKVEAEAKANPATAKVLRAELVAEAKRLGLPTNKKNKAELTAAIADAKSKGA